MSRKFEIYTRNGCPYCDRIKKVLTGKGQQFTEHKLGSSFDREGFYQQFGRGSTFPQVIMDGKRLGGCSESVKYLVENRII